MKKTTIKIISFLVFSLLLVSSVQASEVIGTLSSGVQAPNATTGVIAGSVGGSQVTGTFGNGNVGAGGTIGGTVTGGTSGGGSGGGNGGGGGSFTPIPTVLGTSTSQIAQNNTGTPAVLGASTSPSFPNTGFPAQANNTPWVAILAFATIILLSNLLIGAFRKNTA